jgi:hypothetical protein
MRVFFILVFYRLTTASFIYIISYMDKFKDFPQQPKQMENREAETYFNNMLYGIRQFRPDEIIAVARSGFSYAMWTAQRLSLPLGAWWPDRDVLVMRPETRRCVFVDDNVLAGSTYLQTKKFIEDNYPDIEWQWAVLFSDWHTPQSVRDKIIQGVRLPYFAEEPMWGSQKVSQDYGVRYRDQQQ